MKLCPRDSKVYIAGKNKTDKINHAFSFGGARLAVRTVEETFGVKINNYIARFFFRRSVRAVISIDQQLLELQDAK